MFERSRSLLLAAAATIALIAAEPALARDPAGGQTPPSAPWAQTLTDVPADADVRYGLMPNGMRYAIMRNTSPPGRASLRLRIDAGSLMETENQLGLAHFMEHMAFNGTTHVPENELLAILERLGLAFGADTNAFTGFDQTAYILELPRTNDETIDTGLFIMREQVSEALMDPAAIDEERGVIAGEARARNNPGFRASLEQIAFLAPGQRVSQRTPIGDLEIIRTAPRARFVEFYQSYYRPSRATLVAVGDFDVDEMERRIVGVFGDWAPKAPDGPEPELGRPQPRGLEARVITEAGLPNGLSINWVRPADLQPDSIARRRAQLVHGLGLAVLNRRFAELSRTDNPPFFSAQVGVSDLVDSIEAATISASVLPGGWERALQALDQEQRRFVQYGVSEDELQREIAVWRSSLDGAVAGVATRQTPGLAAGLLDAVNADTVFTTPQTNLDLFNRVATSLTAAEVNQALPTLFEGGGPLVAVTSSEAVPGGEAWIVSTLEASQRSPVAPLAAPERQAWSYTDFGTPGAVVSRREIAELGATEVTFANGVVLLVKPTDYEDERLHIQVSTGRGEQAFSPDAFDPLQSMVGVLRSGGLGRLSVDDISRALTGHVYGAGLSVGEDRFVLSGSTRPEDLDLQMQFLTAHLTDPAWRSTPYEQNKAQYPISLQLSRATPAGIVGLEIGPRLAGGDLRKGITPPETVAGWRIEEHRTELTALLSDGPLRVTIVGDLSIDDAIRTTAGTFGALAPRPDRLPPAANAGRRVFPGPTAAPLSFTHDGPADQALGMVAWPTTGIADDFTEARLINLLAEVVKLRVYAEVRERQSLAYSPGVAATTSNVYSNYGYLTINAQTEPDKLPAFFSAVDQIVAGLRDRPVTEDELNRAREPMLASLRRSLTNNGWWMGQLAYVNDHPEAVGQVLDGLADLEAATPQDIQALAVRYLRPDRAWSATVTSSQATPASR